MVGLLVSTINRIEHPIYSAISLGLQKCENKQKSERTAHNKAKFVNLFWYLQGCFQDAEEVSSSVHLVHQISLRLLEPQQKALYIQQTDH